MAFNKTLRHLSIKISLMHTTHTPIDKTKGSGGSGRVAAEEEVPRGKTEIDLVIPIVFYNAFFGNSSLFSGCSGCKFRQGIAMAAGGV